MFRLKLCALEDCSTPVRGRQRYCSKHDSRIQRHGDPYVNKRAHEPTCSQLGCSEPFEARGLCSRHYQRQRKLGVLELPGRADLFWRRVVLGDGGCWLWTGALNPAGYGLFNSGEGTTLAHRWAYEHLVAPIPGGLTLDHLCRVRACVNAIEHLDPVPQAVNTRRAVAGRKP